MPFSKRLKTKLLICLDRDGTLILNDEYLGKNKNWRSEIILNEELLKFLRFLQDNYATTKIVITNQSGVARNYFTEITVQQIHVFLNSLLVRLNITIDAWEYCPDVDTNYAKSVRHAFNPNYVKTETARKPSSQMVFNALKKLNQNLADFHKILVLGDRAEDELLSHKISAQYLNIKALTFNSLVTQFEKKLTS